MNFFTVFKTFRKIQLVLVNIDITPFYSHSLCIQLCESTHLLKKFPLVQIQKLFFKNSRKILSQKRKNS